MSNLIKIKRTTGLVPPVTNATEFGLLSYSDGNETLYITKADGNITELGGQGKFFKLDVASNVVLQDFLIGTGDASSGNSRAVRFKSEGSSNNYDVSLLASGTDFVIYDAENDTNQLVVRSDDGTGASYGTSSKYGYSLDGTIILDKKDINNKVSIRNVDFITNTGTGNGLSLDLGTSGYSLTSAAGVSLVANGAAEDIILDSTNGSILIDGGENVEGAVQLIASNGIGTATVKIDSSGSSAQAIDITSAGGVDVSAQGVIDLTSTNNGSAVTIVENGGSSGTVLVRATQGTGVDSVKVDSVAGGVTLSSTGNRADAIYIHTDGGTSDTIRIHSDKGTSSTDGSSAIQLTADVGAINLLSTGNSIDAIKLHTDGGVSETISILASQGTSDSSVDIRSVSGGVKVVSSRDAANAINLLADGGTSGTILLENTLGTGAGAIELKTLAGGISLNNDAAGSNIDVGSAGGVGITAAGTVAITANSIVLSSTTALDLGSTDLSFNTDTEIKTTAGTLTLDGFEGVKLRKAGGLEFEINGNGDTIVWNTGGTRQDPNFDVKGWARLRGGVTFGNLEFDGLNTIDAITGDINLNASAAGEVNINKVDINDGSLTSVTLNGSTLTDNNLVYSRGDVSVPASAHTATSSGTGNKTWTFGGTHGLLEGMAVKVGSEVTSISTVLSDTVVEVVDDISSPFSNLIVYKDSDLFKVSNGAGTTNLSIDNRGNVEISGNTVIGGSLQVNGDMTTINSTVVTIDDATFRLGGDETPVGETSHDLGIVFPYYDTQARMGFMGWDDDRESYIFASDHVEGGVISTVQAATISAKEVKLGDGETTMVNRSEQWQKVYEELWVNPIGEGTLSGEREVPNDLLASHVGKHLTVIDDAGTYKFEMTNVIDGGTY